LIGKVFLWELKSGGKPYIMLLILFLLMYVATDYPPRTGAGTYYEPYVNLLSALNIGWSINEIWWFLLPVVIALAVLLFSYDIDRGLLRTYMLSQASRTSLFIGKLTALFVAVFIPLVVGGALILTLADPTLFLSDPLFVWNGLWLRLVGWALMMYVMIGFSIFPAVLLKKPLYAFVTPYVVFYALQSARLPMSVAQYIPGGSFWLFQSVTPGSPAILIQHDLLRAWELAWPGVAVATALIIISYILFVRMEQT
jgi:ABC-type transport system involved in multi-copper enzyme maturation permease subunit